MILAILVLVLFVGAHIYPYIPIVQLLQALRTGLPTVHAHAQLLWATAIGVLLWAATGILLRMHSCLKGAADRPLGMHTGCVHYCSLMTGLLCYVMYAMQCSGQIRF